MLTGGHDSKVVLGNSLRERKNASISAAHKLKVVSVVDSKELNKTGVVVLGRGSDTAVPLLTSAVLADVSMNPHPHLNDDVYSVVETPFLAFFLRDSLIELEVVDFLVLIVRFLLMLLPLLAFDVLETVLLLHGWRVYVLLVLLVFLPLLSHGDERGVWAGGK